MLQRPEASPELVAGRYRLQRLLARGGMGEVFSALDLSTGSAVALKRMRPELQQQRSLVIHFMREYHALSELRHPRIIEVYDYGLELGTSTRAPYFTMELLDGRDLGELSPLHYREACRYLRDVASSLALLHARRMLHRDLSPRNVRCTSDGRCKLLDFGAMVPFGIPANLTGTPPCIAPEALQGASLDQRSDLYSLGALAYSVLTGRHAYAVTQVSSLPDAWKRAPSRPGRLVREIPAALDTLVTELMSVDPAKRPHSAGDVIDRLTAIAQLEPDDSPAVARSFFVSSQLIGREPECLVLRSHLSKTLTGKGSTLAVVGEAGSGRSRMLAEAALIAQTCGLTVVRLVVRAQRGAASTLVDELVAGVQRAAPHEAELARKGRPLVEELMHASSRVTAHSSEVGAQLLTQVVQYVSDVTRERPLLITVDDLERADEFSSALIVALAHQTAASALALIASHSRSTRASVLAQAPSLAPPLELQKLDRAQNTQFVTSLFGEVANLERVSEWLLRVAGGSPKLTIELAEHLLKRGIVRYSAGAWVLPAEITEAVPPSTAEALLLRLHGVSRVARTLAELLSLRRGGADIESFLGLVGEPDDSVFRALDELVRAGVFESAGSEYAFAQQGLRSALARSLSSDRSQELHTRWADWLLARSPLDEDSQLEAGWHLVHTERALLGADLLAKVGPALFARRESMAAAIPAIERALELYEHYGRPLHECLHLRALLVLSSYLFDHRLAQRYGDATLDALYPFTGLAVVERLSRFVGKTLGFALGLGWTALRWCFRWGPQRGPSVIQALTDYGRSAMGLMGLRALAVDVVGTRAVMARLRVFEGSPIPMMALIHAVAEAIMFTSEGRWADTRRALEHAFARLSAGKLAFVSAEEHTDILTGALLLKGINACYRVPSDALECARLLEEIRTPLAAASAMRVRMTYHICRAELEPTQYYRRQLDLHAIQHGTSWQNDWIAVSVESLAGALWHDLPMLRRTVDRTEQLTIEVPGFVGMRDTTRLDYHFLCGDFAEIVTRGEAFIARYEPRGFISWMSMYALTALAYVELGQPERAKAICERALCHVSDHDREFIVMVLPLDAAYATTLAVLGERERAEAIFAAHLTRLREAGEHVRVFQVLQYRVEMLRLLGDRAALREAIIEMHAAAQASGNAAVSALVERVAALRLRPSSPAPAAPAANDQLASPTGNSLDAAETSVTQTDVTVAVRRRTREG